VFPTSRKGRGLADDLEQLAERNKRNGPVVIIEAGSYSRQAERHRRKNLLEGGWPENKIVHGEGQKKEERFMSLPHLGGVSLSSKGSGECWATPVSDQLRRMTALEHNRKKPG